tara:strand:- start:120 stop:950 length:831 start_codon:yes stop_codon:yes gene_type:complete
MIHLKAPTIGGDPGKISLIKEGRGGFVVTELKEFDDPSYPFYPCVVAWDGAENFYNNWLDGSIAIPPATHEYYNNINAMNMTLTSRTELITPTEGPAPGRKYDISDYDNRRYLYKADDEHFCFISIHGGGSCSLKQPSHRSIEEGCLDSMPFFVGTCDGSNDAVNRFYSKCDSICDKMDQECMIGIDDGKDITRCDDNSLRFEGYDDYCICGDASDKIGGSDQNCGDVCATITKACLLGIDEGKNAKKCTDEINFDDGYDYCICGDASEKVVPIPT